MKTSTARTAVPTTDERKSGVEVSVIEREYEDYEDKIRDAVRRRQPRNSPCSIRAICCEFGKFARCTQYSERHLPAAQ